MAIVERHSSPDGLLQIIVERTADDDWCVGFEGLSWHTHGDLLADAYGGPPQRAIRAFVDDVIASRRVIVISRIDGKLADAWVADDRVREDPTRYALPNETIEQRWWNGQILP